MAQVQYTVVTLALGTTSSPQTVVGADNRRVVSASVRQLDSSAALSLRLGAGGPSFRVYQGDIIDLSEDDHRAGIFYECIGAGMAQILVSFGDTN